MDCRIKPSIITPPPNKNKDEDFSSLHSREDRDDFYKKFRGYLILGRFLGVVPIQNVFQPDVNKLYIRKTGFGYIFSLLLITLISLWAFFSLARMTQVKMSSAKDLAWAAFPVIYTFYGVFCYMYFLWNGETFIRLFQRWNQQPLVFFKKDVHLQRDMIIICIILFTSAVLENGYLQVLQFTDSKGEILKLNISESLSPLKIYYYVGRSEVSELVPYNPVVTILLFIGNKFILYTWFYLDVFIVFISRALCHQFKSLIEKGEEKLFNGRENDSWLWKTLMTDHRQLCLILEEFANVLSPLIFFSYSMNTFFSCLQWYNVLTPSSFASFGNGYYAAWAIIQLSVKMMIVTVSASNLQENVQGIAKVFEKCPQVCQTPGIERFERKLESGKHLGFHGLGCFRITRSLLLSNFYYILTFGLLLGLNS